MGVNWLGLAAALLMGVFVAEMLRRGILREKFAALWLVVAVQTTVTSDGNATVTFALQTDSAVNFATAETLLATAAIAKASLTAGTQVIRARIPMGCKRYLRVLYTIGTAVLTAGKFDAYLVSGIDKLS